MKIPVTGCAGFTPSCSADNLNEKGSNSRGLKLSWVEREIQ
jgi:hypothetical protein